MARGIIKILRTLKFDMEFEKEDKDSFDDYENCKSYEEAKGFNHGIDVCVKLVQDMIDELRGDEEG